MGKLPYVDVAVGPGDLMYFPPHYWHEVHNDGPVGGFGLAIGLRPKRIFEIKQFLLPFLMPESLAFHKLALPCGVLGGLLSGAFNPQTFMSTSGIKVREETGVRTYKWINSFYPGFSWNKWELSRTLADNIFSSGPTASKLFGSGCPPYR